MAGVGALVQRTYETLRDRYGDAAPGTQLPTLVELVAAFAVAPMTVREALARLEDDGCIVREQGRGTFVRARVSPAVLVVDDEPALRRLTASHVTRLGYRAVEAAGSADGLAALDGDAGIALVLSDVRMPDPEDGIAFIRLVGERWPQLPLAAITGCPEDLTPLHGTPHCPVLILQKPVWAHDVEAVVRLTLPGKPDTLVGMP